MSTTEKDRELIHKPTALVCDIRKRNGNHWAWSRIKATETIRVRDERIRIEAAREERKRCAERAIRYSESQRAKCHAVFPEELRNAILTSDSESASDEDRPLSDGGLMITCAGVPIAVAIIDERQYANALLIAAAPYLLEALEGIIADDSPLVTLSEQQERWADRMESARMAAERAKTGKYKL